MDRQFDSGESRRDFERQTFNVMQGLRAKGGVSGFGDELDAMYAAFQDGAAREASTSPPLPPPLRASDIPRHRSTARTTRQRSASAGTRHSSTSSAPLPPRHKEKERKEDPRKERGPQRTSPAELRAIIGAAYNGREKTPPRTAHERTRSARQKMQQKAPKDAPHTQRTQSRSWQRAQTNLRMDQEGPVSWERSLRGGRSAAPLKRRATSAGRQPQQQHQQQQQHIERHTMHHTIPLQESEMPRRRAPASVSPVAKIPREAVRMSAEGVRGSAVAPTATPAVSPLREAGLSEPISPQRCGEAEAIPYRSTSQPAVPWPYHAAKEASVQTSFVEAPVANRLPSQVLPTTVMGAQTLWSPGPSLSVSPSGQGSVFPHLFGAESGAFSGRSTAPPARLQAVQSTLRPALTTLPTNVVHTHTTNNPLAKRLPQMSTSAPRSASFSPASSVYPSSYDSRQGWNDAANTAHTVNTVNTVQVREESQPQRESAQTMMKRIELLQSYLPQGAGGGGRGGSGGGDSAASVFHTTRGSGGGGGGVPTSLPSALTRSGQFRSVSSIPSFRSYSASPTGVLGY